LFDLKAMPRGTSGKGNRQQLKTSMLAAAAATGNASVRPARNRDSTVRVNFDRLIMSRAGPLYQSVNEARDSIGRYLDFYNGRRPHSSLDDMTPDKAYFTPLPIRLAA
jgi:transposase InsO family protein